MTKSGLIMGSWLMASRTSPLNSLSSIVLNAAAKGSTETDSAAQDKALFKDGYVATADIASPKQALTGI